MNQSNSRSGFAVSYLIFIMVGILILAGIAGYLYLNSISTPNTKVISAPADFTAGDAVQDPGI